jgi:serine/threonine-protein kinase
MKHPLTDEPTGAYPPPSSTPAATRCRVARCGVSKSRFRQEIVGLLRTRLQVVVLIILVPLLFFLARAYLDGEGLHTPGSNKEVVRRVHTGVAVASLALAGLLWSPVRLSFRPLRVIELTLFGLMAGFFGLIQWMEFNGRLFSEAAAACPHLQIDRVLVVGTTVRWFFLIVVYGVFIPNTWLRCLLITMIAGATPVVIGLATYFRLDRPAPDLVTGLVDLSVLMLTGVAVAVFGSYRLHVLQEQAFTAQQLGQYRLKRRLGKGGMGEVYLAEHLLLRRPCAVKLIRPDQAGNPTNLHRFEREVQAMAALTHWNTVEIFDYGHAEDGTFYYVMEYLPGLNLEALVARDGPLPPGRAVHFLRQVCRALREAHGVGLLHRDIKPSNIIATTRGAVPDVVKLLDFGLVQGSGLEAGADRLTVQGTILGSPPYMSPEQAAGKNDLDPRSDIYSLGGVAYFLLTGQPPFVRETAMEMLLAHAYESPMPPTQLRVVIPADLEAVVLRCLAKKPAERIQTVTELEKALGACACAAYWTEDDAAVWWKRQAPPADTDQNITNEAVTLSAAERVGAISG